MAAKVLIVDDESAIADSVIFALQRENYQTHYAQDGASCLQALKSFQPQLVILDIGLPDISGFELCKKIRQNSDVPIIFLSARADEIDKILGLEIGADDYVSKPFSPRELVARVKVILRRQELPSSGLRERGNNRAPDTPNASANISSAINKGKSITAVAEQNCLYVGSEAIELTSAEFKIIQQLIARPRVIFSRAELLDIAQCSEDSSDRTIDAHIKSLRHKLKTQALEKAIQTHRGIGYSWSIK